MSASEVSGSRSQSIVLAALGSVKVVGYVIHCPVSIGQTAAPSNHDGPARL